jgi:E3 ubiquitin-protein ligase HUWE1
MLLENCGNRSIYASSPHLSDLLNSTSLSLLASTLQIGSQLARRYQASFKRMAPHRHANAALLANHYNIDLDRVEHLAQPFVRTTTFSESALLTTPATPSSKGKEKLYFSIPASNGKAPASTLYANDLVSMVRGSSMSSNSPYGRENLTAPLPTSEASWDEWGDVRLTYYANHGFSEPESAFNAPGPVNPLLPTPVTPTPIRRTSTLGHQHGQKTTRLAGTDDSFNLAARNAVSSTDETQVSSLKVVEIPRSKVKTTAVHQLLKENLPTLPQDSRYEFLTKLRVANALTTSIEARRQMLAVRILAITNLAYIHTESVFIEKVLKQDGDEPRRLQLIYQLADLIHPPADGYVGIPRRLQTIAMSGLEALAQHQAKFQDICTALNTNVSHGVLLYIVRKAVAEMAADEPGENLTEKDEWRGALFQLLSHVATLLRAGSEMVTAGLVPILVEVLTLRTGIAERNYPKILQFLDAIIFNVRDAPQILVNADGLEAIQDLIVHEVKTASESAGVGEGMPYAYRSPSIDYQIPYFQQQSIKWLFKFIHHMMTTAGGYGGNLDRLLRNLIDSSPLLGSLREIIGHTHCFGSTVWTNAVGILNDFINNEPTSFAVIAEAGLSRELLQSVTGNEVKMPEESKDSQMQIETGNDGGSPAHSDDDSVASAIVADDAIPHPPTIEMLEAPRERPLAQGILPSAEAISIIPQAFGAICLNTAGMRMFQSSSALENFFEIFESPKHVQCMENDPNLATNLGSSFDELVRHHPPLKTAIMNATLDMVARVAHLCKKQSSTDKIGTRLWTTDANGKIVVADDRLYASTSTASKGKGKADSLDTDVEMSETMNDTVSPLGAQTENVGYSMTPFVFSVATFLSTMFSNIAVRVAFMEKGGIEYVLDLAELPTLPYDFADDRASRTLHTVIALLAEQKPHLVLPSLVKRAQAAVDNLTSFAESTQHKEMKAYFARFVSDGSVDFADNEGMKELANGTRLAKAFVNVLSLTTALHQCFQTPVYNHRTSGPTFNQMNLADYYNSLVRSLGAISAASIREDFILQKGGLVPAHWKRSTRTREIVFSDSGVDDLIGLEPRAVATDGLTVTRTAAAGEQAPVFVVPSTGEVVDQPSTLPVEGQALTKRERESSRFQNFQTLRYLLSKTPPTISLFFQSLGKALISKRNLEPYQRQSHVSIADALAETVLLQLSPFFIESSIENYTYWIVMLGTVKDLLINGKVFVDPSIYLLKPS